MTQPSLEALLGDPTYQPPLLNSHENILLVINQIFRAQLARKIDLKKARFYLQIVSTAMRVIREKSKEEKEKAAETATSAKLITNVTPAKPVVDPPAKPVQPAIIDLEQGVLYDPEGCFQDFNAHQRQENAAKLAKAQSA
jgi:hypothetical protein